MSDITQKERFMRALEGKEVDKVPVCSVTQTGTLDLMQLTDVHWPEAHFDPEKMATLAIAGHDIVGFEGVRFPFDGTDIPQTLGCTMREGTFDTQPSITNYICETVDDAKNLTIPEDFLTSDRIETMLKTTEIVKTRVGDDVPIIAGHLGPAAVALSLVGVKNYLMWFISEPDTIKDLIILTTDVCIEYANALLEHGADVVCMPDSEAGPELIPPSFFESMILPEYQRMNKKINGKTIVHMCGGASEILETLADGGFEGISVEEKVEIGFASSVIGDKACLIGNVAPVQTLLGSTAEQVKEEAKQCIEDGVNILAPGCGLAPHTALENVKALVAARDEYYQEKGLL